MNQQNGACEVQFNGTHRASPDIEMITDPFEMKPEERFTEGLPNLRAGVLQLRELRQQQRGKSDIDRESSCIGPRALEVSDETVLEYPTG